jgi:hypothetical protein
MHIIYTQRQWSFSSARAWASSSWRSAWRWLTSTALRLKHTRARCATRSSMTRCSCCARSTLRAVVSRSGNMTGGTASSAQAAAALSRTHAKGIHILYVFLLSANPLLCINLMLQYISIYLYTDSKRGLADVRAPRTMWALRPQADSLASGLVPYHATDGRPPQRQ